MAIKILEKARINDVADVERVAREIHILKLIRHPNIIQLYEVMNFMLLVTQNLTLSNIIIDNRNTKVAISSNGIRKRWRII